MAFCEKVRVRLKLDANHFSTNKPTAHARGKWRVVRRVHRPSQAAEARSLILARVGDRHVCRFPSRHPNEITTPDENGAIFPGGGDGVAIQSETRHCSVPPLLTTH
jgi:hypothetical protein